MVNNYSNYSYEIIWITSPQDLLEQPELVDAFVTLYEDPSNFPDADEREDARYILDRIASGSTCPHTHLMLYLLCSPGGEKRFVSGCVVEFYPDSACGLVSYLFVEAAYRSIRIGQQQEKIAESMATGPDGFVGLMTFLQLKYQKMWQAVFFESQNPFSTHPGKESIPANKRIEFLHRLGARRVNFDYIQLSLDDQKQVATNLYLLTIPWLTGLGDAVPIRVVLSFVMELFRSLDHNKAPDSPSRYGDQNYQLDAAAVGQVNTSSPLNPEQTQLIGLTVGERNLIREMYHGLLQNQVDSESVNLLALCAT